MQTIPANHVGGYQAHRSPLLGAFCWFLSQKRILLALADVWRSGGIIRKKTTTGLCAAFHAVRIITKDQETSKHMQPLYTSPEELNSHPELFCDPEREDTENTGPFVIVCDDFYPNPSAVRRMALNLEYFQYKPPLAGQVGQEIAAQYPDPSVVWESSSLLKYLGKRVKNPQPGYRYSTPEVRELLGNVINERINTDTWDTMGDWWNGAFHLQYEAGENVHRVVHHHYREGDVVPRGWSGLVYLSPSAPKHHGTTIWRNKKTKLCIAPKGNNYEQDTSLYDLALSVENKFNRLVLFRENVLHRAGHGFGTTPDTARLMQTFFFQTEHGEVKN